VVHRAADDGSSPSARHALRNAEIRSMFLLRSARWSL
jgi:hypothetical protein